MKEKIVWILIAVMAAAFLYLKVRQAIIGDGAQETDRYTTTVIPTESASGGRVEESHAIPNGERVTEQDAGSLDYAPTERRGSARDDKSARIKIGETLIAVEIADTDAKRAQGLSGRPSLAEDRGMLFIMDAPAVHYFWMKDMKFPLDIIWIRDGRVVDISENVPAPEGDAAPMVVHPSEPADQALEVNAGFAQARSIEIGNAVRLEI